MYKAVEEIHQLKCTSLNQMYNSMPDSPASFIKKDCKQEMIFLSSHCTYLFDSLFSQILVSWL